MGETLKGDADVQSARNNSEHNPNLAEAAVPHGTIEQYHKQPLQLKQQEQQPEEENEAARHKQELQQQQDEEVDVDLVVQRSLVLVTETSPSSQVTREVKTQASLSTVTTSSELTQPEARALALEQDEREANDQQQQQQLQEQQQLQLQLQQQQPQLGVPHVEEVRLPRSYPIVDLKGRFFNPFDSNKMRRHTKLRHFLWLTRDAFTKDKSSVPRKKSELDSTLPILPPNWALLRHPEGNSIQVTWIGHSTLLMQIQGKTILFDPVFAKRCSPLKIAGPKRFRAVPIKIPELPRIDFCCVSHDHFDHLNKASVRLLNKCWPNIKWYVPQKCNDILEKCGVPPQNIKQFFWWDETTVTDPFHGTLTFVFTPAQHWGKRGLRDTWKRLWGSWCIVGEHQRFCFAGDSGMCRAFKEIGQEFGPFDVAAIPIGAYTPRWFCKPQHINPHEAIQVHADLGAKKSVAIHWGTFKLSIEHYLTPRRLLTQESQAAGLDEDTFTTMAHGETRVYYPDTSIRLV